MFRCLVLRHAAAEAQCASGLDADRALTAAGRADMDRAAGGMKQVLHTPDLIATSPYERARATAGIVADAFGGVPVEPLDLLAAGARPEDMLAWLGARKGRLVVLVGHEPDLGRFVSLALAGVTRSFYPMHKGEACLIEFPAVPRAGNATLEWALEGSHLALIGAAGVATEGI